MRKRRIIVAAVVLILLAGIVSVLWSVLDWPPPGLILKYGFPPAGGPTGRTMLFAGVEFVETEPGYRWVAYPDKVLWEGDLLGRLCRPLGIPLGEVEVRSYDHLDRTPPRWVEVPRSIWISVRPLVNADYEPYLKSHPDDRHFVTKNDGAYQRILVRPYCKWLSKNYAGSFRLPKESEWMLAWSSGAIRLDPIQFEELLCPPDRRDAAVAIYVPPFLDLGQDYETGARVRLVWIPPEHED